MDVASPDLWQTVKLRPVNLLIVNHAFSCISELASTVSHPHYKNRYPLNRLRLETKRSGLIRGKEVAMEDFPAPSNPRLQFSSTLQSTKLIARGGQFSLAR